MAPESLTFSERINWLFGPGQPHLHFFMLSLITLVSAIGVVSVRNLVHAAMLMSLSFVGVAGIFILLNAEFLAAVQILIYAGAIVVLVIFAIMLSENIVGKNIQAHNRQSITALVVSIAMGFAMLAILLYDTAGKYVGGPRWQPTPDRNPFPHIDNSILVGNSLMSTYTLAFWIASIILMVAMIGALIIARNEDRHAELKTDSLDPPDRNKAVNAEIEPPEKVTETEDAIEEIVEPETEVEGGQE